MGMLTCSRFLLVGLHLDSLRDKITPKAIKSASAELPQGSKAYEQTYQKALERIDSQDAGLTELARNVIACLVYAERDLNLLKTIELQHALGVEIGEPSSDEDNISDPETMICVCAGLVTIDEDSNVIRLVHYTTLEYFKTSCMS